MFTELATNVYLLWGTTTTTVLCREPWKQTAKPSINFWKKHKELKNGFQEVSDNTPVGFRRSCLGNTRLGGAGGAMQSHRSKACFCHRGMVVVAIEMDIFLYLHLPIIDIGISPEIRMPVRFWTEHLVQSSLHDLEVVCLPSNCFIQWQFVVLEQQMNPVCSH